MADQDRNSVRLNGNPVQETDISNLQIVFGVLSVLLFTTGVCFFAAHFTKDFTRWTFMIGGTAFSAYAVLHTVTIPYRINLHEVNEFKNDIQKALTNSPRFLRATVFILEIFVALSVAIVYRIIGTEIKYQIVVAFCCIGASLILHCELFHPLSVMMFPATLCADFSLCLGFGQKHKNTRDILILYVMPTVTSFIVYGWKACILYRIKVLHHRQLAAALVRHQQAQDVSLQAQAPQAA